MEPESQKDIDYQSEFRHKINNYEQTIHALIGFMNFYRYDDENRRVRPDVIIFQGWRLDRNIEDKSLSERNNGYVTPDLGILYAPGKGVLAEAKKSFTKQREHWMDDFEQLMSYDEDLTGWPCDGGTVENHDIVLLLDQTRGVAVKRFYENKRGKEIIFKRPFIIVQFNRSTEDFYFFQKIEGDLSEPNINEKLIEGVPVPMVVFVNIYSEIKLYDDEPPLPYLIDLIWTNIVFQQAARDPKFEKLKKNQKIEVILNIDNIVDEIQRSFTFQTLCPIPSERQKKIPRRSWIVNACEGLIRMGEANWVDRGKKNIKIYFRIYEDVLDHFITDCSNLKKEEGQPKLL